MPRYVHQIRVLLHKMLCIVANMCHLRVDILLCHILFRMPMEMRCVCVCWSAVYENVLSKPKQMHEQQQPQQQQQQKM